MLNTTKIDYHNFFLKLYFRKILVVIGDMYVENREEEGDYL